MNTQKIVGVDTHKDTIACYCDGKFKEFKTNSKGFSQAIKWAGKAQWAIEGAYCFGRAFTAHLIKNGCEVYEINPLLTKNWRGALKVAAPKNDYGDAKVISIFANTSNLEKMSLETTKLKEKLSARKSLVKQKTKTTNFIKMLYFTRGEQLPFKKLDTKKAVNYLINNDDIIIKTQGKILKEVLDGINVIEKEIEKETPQKAKKLMELKGISYITASTIYTETKGKVTTAAKLASYCGLSPIDCSSGKTTRKKNNKGGNRILNSVFYSLSIAQKRYNPISQEYYEKKISEGKTKRHARKCLARQLVNIVFKILKDD
jgi:transposase